MALDDILLGNEFVLYIDTTTPITAEGNTVQVPGNFKGLGCFSTNGFSTEKNLIEVSNKCSGKFRNSKGGSIGWGFSGSGNTLITSDDSDPRMTTRQVLEFYKAIGAAWFAMYDPAQSLVIYGVGEIVSFNLDAPTDASFDFTIDITGKGEFFTLEAAPAATLSGITSNAALAPSFSPDITEYTAATASSSLELLISFAAGITATVDGTPATSGSLVTIPLDMGSNTVVIELSSSTAASNTYTIVATRS